MERGGLRGTRMNGNRISHVAPRRCTLAGNRFCKRCVSQGSSARRYRLRLPAAPLISYGALLPSRARGLPRRPVFARIRASLLICQAQQEAIIASLQTRVVLQHLLVRLCHTTELRHLRTWHGVAHPCRPVHRSRSRYVACCRGRSWRGWRRMLCYRSLRRATCSATRRIRRSMHGTAQARPAAQSDQRALAPPWYCEVCGSMS